MIYPQFYFLRHAESLHNQRASKVKTKYNLSQDSNIVKYPEYRQIKFGQKYFDCDITQLGYSKQCQNAKKQCENLNIELILVSPLRRALITCNQVFKDHKNKPTVIVQPLLGQRMTSACDLGTKLRQSMQNFDFDFSQFKKLQNADTWYIDNLPKATQNNIYQKIQQANAKTAHQIGKVLLKSLQEQGSLQSLNDLAKRVQILKDKLYQLKLKTNKKIMIVAHSNLIKTMTATGYLQNGTPINGIELKNCESQLINIVIPEPVYEEPKEVYCKI